VSLPRSVVTAGTSALATRTAARLLAARPPGGVERWTRTNHRGEPISLLEGPAFVVGSLVATALAGRAAAGVRRASLLSLAAAGALGAYDDLAEGGLRKGLKGHLGALARGEVTTGAVKVIGLAVTGLAASLLVRAGDDRSGSAGPVARCADVLVGGAVVAGAANLVNLLDLRPGRALKAVLLAVPFAVTGGAGALPLAAAAGGAASMLPGDLAERTMLGDTGANAAGALLGVAALTGTRPAGRAWLLAGLAALTLASERVSFTRVIESTPGLRELDGLGRRAPGPAGT
jgi:UDP-GlcNAc:undecaprenyl-phosphate/decaprenyl-phosphate GlcNAc-1-phosphate transferase